MHGNLFLWIQILLNFVKKTAAHIGQAQVFIGWIMKMDKMGKMDGFIW